MQTPTTAISQDIKKGLEKLEELKGGITMQSTMKHQSNTASKIASLAFNARTLIVTAMAASLFLISSNMTGTAFAQPVSDPVTVFTSSVLQSWDNASEEAQWPTASSKLVISTGQAYIGEESDWTFSAPKLAFATIQGYMSEENGALPKVAFATVQSYMSEENGALPKVSLATVQSYMSEENGSLPKVSLASIQSYMSEENGSLPKVGFATSQTFISEESESGLL